LATARSKGNNAAIESQLQSIQQQAELDDTNNHYAYPAGGTPPATAVAPTAACPSSGTSAVFVDPQIIKILTQISANSGGGLTACSTPVGGSYWAVAGVLATDKALAWCVDSTGVSKQEGTAGGTPLTQATLGGTTAGIGAFNANGLCQ
jgi:hypothetical protein